MIKQKTSPAFQSMFTPCFLKQNKTKHILKKRIWQVVIFFKHEPLSDTFLAILTNKNQAKNQGHISLKSHTFKVASLCQHCLLFGNI